MDHQQLITKYIQGTITEAEKEDFYHWLGEEPENKIAYFQEKDLWDSLRMQADSDKIDLGKEWQEIDRRIGYERGKKRYLKRKTLAFAMTIAASVILLFGLGWITRSFIPEGDHGELMVHQMIVPRGQRSMLKLADGTTVWLNSDSKINFSNFSNNGPRRVVLQGEAFFDVAKDKDHPFFVETRDQEIKVLGTAFNVRAYDDEPFTYTTLVRGQVQVSAGGRVMVLRPGRQLAYDRSGKDMKMKEVETAPFTSWREGRYVFENESFDDLVKMVERWYDVEFSYPKDYFKDRHYSGVMKRIKPLEHVLSLINHVTPIEYEIKGDVVNITPKH